MDEKEKKIVLAALNAKYIHSNPAVYSLRANAGEYKDRVEICEYTINHRREEVLRGLYERLPDAVGFSCYIWNIEMIRAVARDLKKVLPDIVIFAGGPEVSWHPGEFLEREPCFDVVMCGEGERTFYEYAAYFFDGRGELKNIDGLAFRAGEKIARTGERSALDMDALIFPYAGISTGKAGEAEILSDRTGGSASDEFENRIFYYESSRGCPFLCSYCLSSVEKSVRKKSLPKVFSELDFFLERRVPQVKFVDRTFNCDRVHACGIWEYISRHDNGVTNFHFEIGGGLLEAEDFEILESFRPGLAQFEIGVQTTNEETLRAIRRADDLKQLRRNVERLRRGHNIHIHLDLIAGLPFEDYISFQKSFNDVYDMRPDQLQLGFLKVLDGSYMSEAAEEYGLVYSDKPPYEVMSTRWLSFEDILRLKRVEEMVEIYCNSLQFSASMAWLRRFFETPFAMYRELGHFYEKRGLAEKHHSRLRRYELLWEFVTGLEGVGEAEKEEFREVITYDLYSRDYVKNPPAFVRRRTDGIKKQIRNFFDRECENPTVLSGYEGFVTKQLYNLLYVDCFTICMEILIETGEVQREQPFFLMFDYRKRNPLDHSARVVRLDTPVQR